MYIHQVISYGNSWKQLVKNHPAQLGEIQAAIAELTRENIERAEPIRPSPSLSQNEPGITPWRLEGCWDVAIRGFGWQESVGMIDVPGLRPIYLRSLGYIKDGLSISFQRHREILNRWLFTVAPIACRNGFVDIPITIVMLTNTEELLLGRRGALRTAFERTRDELVALSPLSHHNPFLILGISLEEQPIEVVELDSEAEIGLREVIINRSIEFPPEYHQAGLGILNYFGTVLREKYPDEKAKVKIEQDGLCVRLIVESENGNREVIEKALHEYEMVIRGEAPPEGLFSSRLRVIELKNELRIANIRIESQRDFIEHQKHELITLKQLIGHALSSPLTQPPLAITVSPVINVSTSQNTAISIRNEISAIAQEVQDLVEIAKQDPSIQARLLDLEDALITASKKNTAEEVRCSSGFQKLTKLLGDANEVGSDVNTFLTKCTDAVGFIQKLARRYNDVAEWCGAPQIPSVLTGRDS